MRCGNGHALLGRVPRIAHAMTTKTRNTSAVALQHASALHRRGAWKLSSGVTATQRPRFTSTGRTYIAINRCLGLLGLCLVVGLLGCSPSVDKQIPGTWQGINGIQVTLIFSPGGGFKMMLPAIPSVPFSTESTGSYSITKNGEVQILEGGETHVAELQNGELVMVRPWSGDIATRFRKLQ